MTTPSAAADPHAGPPVQVLLVEDEEEIRKMIKLYLQGRGLVVREAAHGEQGWAEYLREPPDVLLTDVVLPRLNGRDLVERIHKHEGAQRVTPVVVMSASFLNARDERAFLNDVQVDAVFRKPLPLRELAATVVELGRHHRRVKAEAAAATAAGHPPAPTAPRAAPVMATVPPKQVTLSRLGALTGDNSVNALAAVAGRCFQERLDIVLEVASEEQTRRILFHDGLVVGTTSSVEEERLGSLLMEAGLISVEQAAAAAEAMKAEGVRFGYAVVKAAGIPPSAVVQALEEQTLWVAMQALAMDRGTWVLKPMTENPVLAMQLRMDPMETVQRACLERVAPEATRNGLKALGTTAGHLLRGHAFEERVLTFAELRPHSAVVGSLLDEPPWPEAVRRAENLPGGTNELLALMLSGAFYVGEVGKAVPPQKRDPALGTLGGRWRGPDLSQKVIQIREEVALEWLRTGGRTPAEILSVRADAPPEMARAAARVLTQKFGPPALDDVDLGPAKRCLQVVRSRLSEAVRLRGL